MAILRPYDIRFQIRIKDVAVSCTVGDQVMILREGLFYSLLGCVDCIIVVKESKGPA